jgi:Zn-dependent protease
MQSANTVLSHYILSLPGILLALMIHGYFQSIIGFKQGDRYIKLHGKLRFSLKKHVEPVGFLLMLTYGYGWGQPVDANVSHFTDRRRGAIVTYVAPALINILFGCVAAVLLLVWRALAAGAQLPLTANGWMYAKLIIGASGWRISQGFNSQVILIALSGALYQIIYQFARCNLTLAIFNILPIYPMDCYKVLLQVLPAQAALKLSRYQAILQTIMVFVLILGIFNAVFDPLVNMVLRFVS